MRAKRLIVIAFLMIAPVLSAGASPPKIPDLEGSQMKIPWSDFKKILEMIQPEEKKPEEVKEPVPPAPFVLTSARYEGRLEADAAVFDASIEFTVLDKKQWLEIPVLNESLAVEEVKLDGEPVLIEIKNGWHGVLIQSPGKHTLKARFYVPFGNARGPRSLSLSVARTPVTTLSFKVDEPGLDIKASPANVNKVTSDEKSSSLESVIVGADRISISWSKKVETEGARLRLNAEVESLVSIGERLCQLESVIKYEILHKGVTGFRFSLPKDVSVVDVTGVGVADWKSSEEGDKQVVEVGLNFEAKGGYHLRVLYETALPDATAKVEVPELTVLDVNREIGYLGVVALTNIELDIGETSELASTDVSMLPGGMPARSATPLLYGFKYIDHPWSLAIQSIKHQNVDLLTSTVDEANLTSLLTKDGELVTRARYTIRNNRRQFMRMKLPQGSRVFSTFRDGRPVQPARDKEGNLLIPLEKSSGETGEARSFTLEVTYLEELSKKMDKKGKVKLNAPEIDLLANSISWSLFTPRDYKYEVDETTLEYLEEPEGEQTIIKPVLPDTGRSDFEGDKYRADHKKNYGPIKAATSGKQTYSTTDNEAKGDGDGWVRLVNVDSDEYMQNAFVFTSGSDSWNQDDLVMLVQTNVSQFQSEDQVQATLPVRFIVPQVGVLLKFNKTIIQENESNSIEISYKKKTETLKKAWKKIEPIIPHLTILFWVILPVLLVVWIFRKIVIGERIAKKAAASEAKTEVRAEKEDK